jgi:AraC family transcriptional regulator of adaptative response/methylated-DNA-[protein]-cysteine methyltransferase
MRSEINAVSNDAWDAVTHRDRYHDGKFVYVAITARIYCRPSCPARHPHRRNAVIFPTAADAERRGYVSCRRCYPGTDSLAPAERSTKVALDYIEAHLDQSITLDKLSRVSGLSPNHLQQIFKRIVGLSPKAFCDVRRLARFKERLRAGESISSACYDVGYGSSRALYEKALKALGMTPAVYQRGGDGVVIRYCLTGTMQGRVLLAGTDRGVCAVLLGTDDKFLFDELHQEFPRAVIKLNRKLPRRWIVAVRSCQREDRLLSKLPPTMRVTVLLTKIWSAVQ